MKLDDGRSIKYKSLIYEVTKIHKLYLQEYDEGEDPYLDGWEIKLFGVSIYKQTWNEDAKDSRVPVNIIYK